ncbi:hypothetical protein RJT34_04127 [Clitoria ternatea]|uniref:HMA domain-containing protein n=1 Tax=Clitoria ternatea TaxID=43366 RepID=A0AAN9KMX0_CLITE
MVNFSALISEKDMIFDSFKSKETSIAIVYFHIAFKVCKHFLFTIGTHFFPSRNSSSVMSLKSNNKKMRRGFMCHSQASTAVCMSTRDPRSVVVPRRIERSVFLDDTRLISYAKYSKLVEPPKPNPVPMIKLRDQDQAIQPTREPQKTPSDNVFQVVVMRVAIHCQGCAGKVKKHLSKMEGVTSFSIDVESKRVTVMGHISPVAVLESISKVKRAELWNAC